MGHNGIKIGQTIKWWVRSDSDPRWNCDGVATMKVGGGPPGCVVDTLEDFRIEYGPVPEDLEWGVCVMRELKVNTYGVKPQDANALIVCDCGALISVNVLDVRFHNEMVTKCGVCKLEILVKEGGPECVKDK